MNTTTQAGPCDSPLPDAAGLFRAIFEQAAIGVAQIETATGRFLQVNQRCSAIVGYSRQEMERIDFQSLTHPDDLPTDLDNMRKLVAGEIREFTREKRYRHKDGHFVWVKLTVSPLWAPGEPPRFHVAVLDDITERKQMEEALKASERRFVQLIQNSFDAVVILDANGIQRYVSASAERVHGYAPAELVDIPVIERMIHPDDQVQVQTAFRQIIETGEGGAQYRHRRKAGGWVHMEARGINQLHNPDIRGVVLNVRDITGRKQAEEALRESEERFAIFMANLPAGAFMKDATGTVVYANRYLCDLFGWGNAIGRSTRDLLPPEVAEKMEAEDRAALAEGLLTVTEQVRDTAQRERIFLTSKFPIARTGQAPLLGGITVDVTERIRAEEALRESEDRLRTIIEEAPFGAHSYELKAGDRLVLTATNRSADRILGINHASLIGQSIEEAFPGLRGTAIPETYRRLADADGSLEDEQVVYEQGSIRGAFAIHAFHTGANRMTVFFRDITERKRAEEEREKLQAQLTQAQKMELVGRLAGGVAHDFNNMLQVILGNAGQVLEELPPESPLRESLEEIRKSANRSADLTRQLLAFARKQTIQPKVLDLNDTVQGMLKMLRRLIGENIQLAWLPGADLWRIKMDPSQLDQILANLCVNARDAIANTGRTTIETSNAVLDATYMQSHPDCVPGNYVLLAVSDTGHGMDAATRAHLFEPFYTTKGVGKGTGLGLATVFGIVKQNHGLINVYSEPGQGTTFKIYLPQAEAETVEAAEDAQQRSLRGSETVLLVEDEEQILNLGRRTLQRQGYSVLAALTPEAALALAAQQVGPIHLLVTDVVMPGMNGKELAERLRTSHPDLKCLFMSGYTADVLAHHGVLEAKVAFLQKPFTLQTLAEKVREVLEWHG